MIATPAAYKDVPSLAWLQAIAFTRAYPKSSQMEPATTRDRGIPAALVFPSFLLVTIEAHAAGGLYHHNREVTAYAKPPGLNWRIIGTRCAAIIVIVLLLVAAGVLAALIHPDAPSVLLVLIISWCLAVIWLLGRHSFTRMARTSERTLAAYVREHQATTIANIAKKLDTPAGTGLHFTRELTWGLHEQGHTTVLVAATPKHLDLYAMAGYAPINTDLAMAGEITQ